MGIIFVHSVCKSEVTPDNTITKSAYCSVCGKHVPAKEIEECDTDHTSTFSG